MVVLGPTTSYRAMRSHESLEKDLQPLERSLSKLYYFYFHSRDIWRHRRGLEGSGVHVALSRTGSVLLPSARPCWAPQLNLPVAKLKMLHLQQSNIAQCRDEFWSQTKLSALCGSIQSMINSITNLCTSLHSSFIVNIFNIDQEFPSIFYPCFWHSLLSFSYQSYSAKLCSC